MGNVITLIVGIVWIVLGVIYTGLYIKAKADEIEFYKHSMDISESDTITYRNIIMSKAEFIRRMSQPEIVGRKEKKAEK